MLIATLILVAQVLTPSTNHEPPPVIGYGPWRLGMSKEEVKAVSEFGPYSEVPSTGGVETTNGLFAERKANISFVFGERGLRIIQIWAYEGREVDEAVNAFFRVYRHLESTRGRVEIPGLQIPAHADGGTFSAAVCKVLASVPTGRAAKLQIGPVEKTAGAMTFSSLMSQPQLGYYYVFLYYRFP
jgi:hypothetical protein